MFQIEEEFDSDDQDVYYVSMVNSVRGGKDSHKLYEMLSFFARIRNTFLNWIPDQV